MAVLNRAGLLSAVLLLSGCDWKRPTSSIEYSESVISVHSVLSAGSGTAAVLLTRFEAGESEEEERFLGISGAAVWIGVGLDSLRLREAVSGFPDCYASPFTSSPESAARSGCYTTPLPGGVRSGQPYELRITLPDGSSVRGIAVVPAAPIILSPEPGRGVPVRTGGPPSVETGASIFPVRWAASPETGRIEIGVFGPRAYRDGRQLDDAQCRIETATLPMDLAVVDSIDHRILAAYCARGRETVSWDSVLVRLVVTAYDTAYARYVREVIGNESVRRSRASAGVQGALGVFAGAASAERRLVLVPAK